MFSLQHCLELTKLPRVSPCQELINLLPTSEGPMLYVLFHPIVLANIFLSGIERLPTKAKKSNVYVIQQETMHKLFKIRVE